MMCADLMLCAHSFNDIIPQRHFVNVRVSADDGRRSMSHIFNSVNAASWGNPRKRKLPTASTIDRLLCSTWEGKTRQIASDLPRTSENTDDPLHSPTILSNLSRLCVANVTQLRRKLCDAYVL